jgi:NAD(P)-dependent dehydrogenase (short-subunit alcohol dehydrogenase family)
MEQLRGKTAVISGGGDGIGFALAQTFGDLGMNIVIADIEKPALERAEETLKDAGVPVLAIEMDVALQDDWRRVAELAQEHFSNIHMLVNNAGVGGAMGAIGNLDDAGWRWAIDVNLMGVVYGAETFVPLMKAHGEKSWLINVASMAGMAGVPLAGSYTATKAAVVALTEAWSLELSDSNISVSVLAPAFVKTRIHQSHRNRQPRYASTVSPGPELLDMAKGLTWAVEHGISPALLCARVLEALEAGETYIFTHPLYRSVTDSRSAAIAQAFESAAASPSVGDVKEQPMAGGFKEH